MFFKYTCGGMENIIEIICLVVMWSKVRFTDDVVWFCAIMIVKNSFYEKMEIKISFFVMLLKKKYYLCIKIV
jgi:hypothetical protein